MSAGTRPPDAAVMTPTARQRLRLLLGVDGSTAVSAVGSGLVVSMAMLVPVVAYPALVFSGPLAPWSGLGVGLGLFSALLLTAALVIGGSIQGTVAVGQSEPAVVLGIAAAAMATELQAAGTPDRLLPTVIAAIAVSALAVGVAFLLLGTMRLGNLIRFVPYPLIVGFIGGMGWLLIAGAVRVVTGVALTFAHLPELAEPPMLARWLPALLVGCALWALQRWRPRALNVPVMAIATVAGFWIVAAAQATPFARLAADGWLLAPIPPVGAWLTRGPAGFFDGVDWAIVAAHWPQILTLVTVSLMGVLMQASVIEIAARADVDLNRELRAMGAGNLLCGGFASLPGYHSLGMSLLSLRIGRPARASGLTVLCVLGVLLAFGGSAVAYVPKLAIGGLLFYVGLDVLLGALLNVHLRRAGAEFAIAMMVLATVAFAGLLQGLALGVGAGIVLFVIKYSQVDVVRRESSAIERHSNVVRPPRARQRLNALGDRVMILELQGYLFFGTSTLLVNRIRARLTDRSRPRPRFVLLDFRRVTGLDSSVSLSLDKLVQYGRDGRCTLVVTGLAQPLRRPFERLLAAADLAAADPEAVVRLFADLDRGLEYCENRLLASGDEGFGRNEEAFEEQLRLAGGSDAEIALLMRYAERRLYGSDEPLMRQGEEAGDLFFIERGMVEVRLGLPDGREIRLRSMGAGTVVGEIAAYLELPRSASVVAECETRAVCIGYAAMAAMRVSDPQAAALLHAFMARQLAEKLVAATQQLAAVQG